MTETSDIIDISLPIFNHMPVYPGTPQVQISTFAGTTTWNSTITFGSHTGTHIDAPKHVDTKKIGIDQIQLKHFIGLCSVIDLTHVTGSISLADIQSLDVKPGQRLLFKTTNSSRSKKTFHKDYIYLSGEAAEFLAQIPIALVGIDYFSIKERGSNDTRAHDAFLDKNIPIIEGITLQNVKPGDYTLIALPLRFQDLDASPARVVLLNQSHKLL